MSKFYVTTSIPYASSKPHIGNAIDWLYADVLARYHRQQGDKVIYSAGADEHGSKIFEAAEKAGQKPEDYIEAISADIKKTHELIGSEYTHFARTNSDQHIKTATKLWLQMSADIYMGKYVGWYCVGCEEFKTETEVKNNNNTCPLHDKPYQKIEENNYFFKLSKYGDKIAEVIESGELEIVPASRKQEILNIIKDGLEDISISRPKEKISWGIEVPGDKKHVMYVWFEALMNYITLLDYPNSEEFKMFWPTNVQIIGKDNLRFHAAIYPAMLISLGLPMLKRLLVHGHLTVDGKKMSKTVGNVVTVNDVVKRYGQDAFRFYFLRYLPTHDDGDFTWAKLDQAYNNELGNELGNLVQRVATMANNYQQGIIGDVAPAEHDEGHYRQAMEGLRFDLALEEVMARIKNTNRYLEETKPWQLAKEGDTEHLREVLLTATNNLLQIARLLEPFLPRAAGVINEVFSRGTVRTYSGVLFPRIQLDG